MFALFACSRSSLFDTAHTPESTEVAALRQSIANWLLLPLEHHKTCEAASQRWGERETEKSEHTHRSFSPSSKLTATCSIFSLASDGGLLTMECSPIDVLKFEKASFNIYFVRFNFILKDV